MANFDADATCAVCRKRHQAVFVEPHPLAGFCERCAWEHDSRKLEEERRDEAALQLNLPEEERRVR